MALSISSHDYIGFGDTAPIVLAAPSVDLSLPALAPPDGIIPNFGNPPSGNTSASAAFIVMMVVSTFCLFVRAAGKLYPRRMIFFEDGKPVALPSLPLPASRKPGADRFSRFQSSSCLPTYVPRTVLDFPLGQRTTG